MRNFTPLLLAVFMISLMSVPASATTKSLTVVELFTSQGCSSCPPADEFAGELAKRDDVLPLSFNVDYWNYIGWKDPFSSPDKTQRQRDYARNLGLRHVYTPQMVINGKTEAVGSKKRTVLNLITEEAKSPKVDIQLSSQGDNLTVSIGRAVQSDKALANILLVVFDRKKETMIKRGENAGRKLAYFNVVQSFESIGNWRGDIQEIKLSKTSLAQHGNGFAILLQQAATGTILGAASSSIH